jgi:excisionase family DNA binding protein
MPPSKRRPAYTATPPADFDRPGTTQEVSHYLRVPVATLYRWRTNGYGPRATIVGRELRYDWDEVKRWVAEQPEKAGAA